MIPLYGFLEGDTVGLLILGYESETVVELAEKIQRSARVRVPHKSQVNVIYKGQILKPNLNLSQTGIEALDRIDVRVQENSDGI